MNARKLSELAAEADRLAATVPPHPVDTTAFEVWSRAREGLLAAMTVDGATTPMESLKAPLSSSALGDLIGGLRTVWQYSRVYSASNQTLVATALRSIASALRSGARTSNGGIFVSFSHADERLASHLFDVLDVAGLSPFKASDPEKGLPAGEGYFENLLAKLREVDSLVFLATPSSVTEAWPVFEAGAVVGRRCRALSICVGINVGALPRPLQPIQAVLATEHLKVKHALAQVAGRDASELWTDAALAKLEAFLQAAAPRLKPGESTVGRALTEYDPFNRD